MEGQGDGADVGNIFVVVGLVEEGANDGTVDSNGSSPIGVRFAVRQMRNHLMKCLLDRELSVFPKQRV